MGGPPESVTERRYDRTAAVYDLYDVPMDVLGGVRGRRARLLSAARGDVLEVGVGTGRNLDLYPEGVQLIGIDVSEGMLTKARARAARLGRSGAGLRIADAEHLPFPDDTFDTVVATCVFCSVDDPVRGLSEVARVVKPAGRVPLLEHVRPRNPLAAQVSDRLDPLLRRTLGFHVTRDIEANARAA